MICYNSELPIGPAGPTGPQGPQGPPGTTLGYKVYTALLTQDGLETAPTAIVLENTLGEVPVWSWFTAGIYYCTTITNVFTTDKTYVQMSMTDVTTSTNNVFFSKDLSVETAVGIQTTTSDGAGGRLDGVLYKTAIEIRVYL